MMKTSTLTKEGWTTGHLVAAVGLVSAAVYITFPAWADMLHIALNDEECGHTLLAIPAFCWLFWIRRGRMRLCRPTGRWVGSLMVLAGAVIWSIGFRKQWQPFWHGGALLMALGAFFTAVGSEILWEFFAAFAVLVFLVPFPTLVRQKLAIPLQGYTAQATQLACEAIGMTVDRQQNGLITLNGVHVAISEACNGMRMFFALIMVCYLFGFVNPLRGYVRFMLILLSPIVAAVCNIIRLVPTVWVFDHYPKPIAETFHDVTGWVMLIVAFLVMLGFLRLLRWAMLPVTHFRLVDVA